MDDDTDAADDERATELTSIAAIFPELVVDPNNPYAVSLDLIVSPATPLKIRFQAPAEDNTLTLPTPPTSVELDEDETVVIQMKRKAEEITEAQIDAHELAHLPPLTLDICLPDGYPHEKAPLVKLSTSPPWLPSTILKKLEADATRLWVEMGREQMVFTYIDHLQQGADVAFNITGKEEQGLKLSSDMRLALLDFDLKAKRELFERQTFDCGVCLEPKKGLHCHRLLLCSHVFCTACLQDCYNSCIKEGNVINVKCLAPDCGKDAKVTAGTEPRQQSPTRRRMDRTLSPSEMLQIPIEQELVQRYVRLKRKKKLESDKSTIYCPRQWCQGAARSKKHPKPVDPMDEFDEEPSETDNDQPGVNAKMSRKQAKPEDIPMAERLCICEDCSFAFCSVCKKGWHGELAVCNPRRQRELNEEEAASIQYLQLHTTPCPTCSAPSQKTMGCNHMICFKCNTHFCYLCSSYLMPDNPYRHFNDMKSPCYMRLWELEGGDGDPDEVGRGFAGGRNWEPDDSDSDTSSATSGSDDEQNFDDFGGDDGILLFADDDESGDDEPAPGQRPAQARDVRIEIVNFGRPGVVVNHRIEVPPVPPQPPPPAPVPPRRGGRWQPLPWRAAPQQPQRRAHARPGQANLPRIEGRPHDGEDVRGHARVDERHQPAEHDNGDEDRHGHGQELVRAAPAPGQGRGAAQQPAPLRAMGLERFLELAQRDQEDEWDSDELDE